MAKINKTTGIQMLEKLWRKKNPFSLMMGMKIGITLETSIENPQKLKIYLPYDSAIPLLCICLKDSIFYSTDAYSAMFITALCTVTRKWKQPNFHLQMNG